jgi:hypothetical protein
MRKIVPLLVGSLLFANCIENGNLLNKNISTIELYSKYKQVNKVCFETKMAISLAIETKISCEGLIPDEVLDEVIDSLMELDKICMTK